MHCCGAAVQNHHVLLSRSNVNAINHWSVGEHASVKTCDGNMQDIIHPATLFMVNGTWCKQHRYLAIYTVQQLLFQLFELLREAAQQLVPVPPIDPLPVVVIIPDRPTAFHTQPVKITPHTLIWNWHLAETPRAPCMFKCSQSKTRCLQ